MELRQLHYFIAVAEALNFRKAAERLHITQPSVSRQIRQLEEELGVALLMRDRKQVHLTDAGRLVLHKAKALVAEAAQLAQSVKRADHGERGSLKVGVGIPLAQSIRGLVTAFARQFPKVDVQYHDIVFPSTQSRALRKAEIDVGIFWPPVDHTGLDCQPLLEERFWVVLPRKNPLAKRRRLRLKELAGQILLLPNQTPAVNDKVLQMCRAAGLTPKTKRTTAVPHEAGAALVASGKGIYVLAGTPLKFPSFGSGIAVVPLDDPSTITVYLAWRRRETSAAVLNFLATARRVFRLASASPRPAARRL
ncbi:MAG: LysR family transcriptional regulator [Acidobacteriia bacterium]|nr:LysR family transcriptional regulator [Terriglobia bacterium]